MKISTTIIILACLNLFACQSEIDSPRQVTEKYWLALKNNDLKTAKQLVSNSSQDNFEKELARPDAEKLPLDEISIGAEQMTVTTIITHNDTHFSFDTILIHEEGKWKVDASRTHVPIKQAAPTTDVLQENIDSMSKALEEGTEMLNQLMQEGSKEMSESLLKGMNKMNESLRDAMEKLKKRREQQESEQTPPKQSNDENGEGLI